MVIKNVKRKLVILAFASTLSLNLSANIEVIGSTYEIEETSLLDSIMSKLKEKEANGEIEKYQEEMKRKSIANIENPKGINLPTAGEDSIRFFDPSVTLKDDITLEDGTVMHRKGTVVNPLAIRPLTKELIFIDGSVIEQVEYALEKLKESGGRSKIILTKGSFGDLTRKYKVRFYFDQQSKAGERGRITLVEEFGIKNLPSVVLQRNPKEYFLTIKEVKL